MAFSWKGLQRECSSRSAALPMQVERPVGVHTFLISENVARHGTISDRLGLHTDRLVTETSPAFALVFPINFPAANRRRTSCFKANARSIKQLHTSFALERENSPKRLSWKCLVTCYHRSAWQDVIPVLVKLRRRIRVHATVLHENKKKSENIERLLFPFVAFRGSVVAGLIWAPPR